MGSFNAHIQLACTILLVLIPLLSTSQPTNTPIRSTDISAVQTPYTISIDDADYDETLTKLNEMSISMEEFALEVIVHAMDQDSSPSLRDVHIEVERVSPDSFEIDYTMTAPQQLLDLAETNTEHSVGKQLILQLGGSWSVWGILSDFEADSDSTHNPEADAEAVPSSQEGEGETRTVVVQADDGLFGKLGWTLTMILLFVAVIGCCLLCVAVAVLIHKGVLKGHGEIHHKYSFVLGFQNFYRSKKGQMAKDVKALQENIEMIELQDITTITEHTHHLHEGPPLPSTANHHTQTSTGSTRSKGSSLDTNSDAASNSAESQDSPHRVDSNPPSGRSQASSISTQTPVLTDGALTAMAAMIETAVTNHTLHPNYQYGHDLEGSTDGDTGTDSVDDTQTLGHPLAAKKRKYVEHKLTVPRIRRHDVNSKNMKISMNRTEATDQDTENQTSTVYQGHYPLTIEMDAESFTNSSDESTPGTWMWFDEDSAGMSVEIR